MSQRRTTGERPNAGTCLVHEKKLWFSRQDAKNAARAHHPGDHLNAYPCTENEGYWHYGHLHSLVIKRGIDIPRGGYGPGT